MAGDSLSVVGTSVGAYYVPKKAKKQPINPSKDKVYVDPKTGEYTTWKPGIYDPEQEKKRSLAKGVVAGALTALLVFMFRGKIKTNGTKLLEKAQPYAQKAYSKAADVVGKAAKVLKPYVEESTKVAGKAFDKLNSVLDNGVKIFAEKVVKPLKNYFVPAVKVAAKSAGA